MKEDIRHTLLQSGASAVGFAEAGEISPSVHHDFTRWIQQGYNGEMQYLERHIPLRKHTDAVLKGAKTVISLAFGYASQENRAIDLPVIASYAYGRDYHIVLREILHPIVKNFQNQYGGKWRICIDSAPLAERYWALKSGIGKRGLNGAVIVKGAGSFCFLVEILTTLEIKPDHPSEDTCEKCGLCISQCPAQAIKNEGILDARKCINYLTIEKKGEFSEQEKEFLKEEEGYLYGCDRCLRICPHNHPKICTTGSLFTPLEDILTLTPQKIIGMDESEFKTLFSVSPLSYAGYQRLSRNARNLIESHIKEPPHKNSKNKGTSSIAG